MRRFAWVIAKALAWRMAWHNARAQRFGIAEGREIERMRDVERQHAIWWARWLGRDVAALLARLPERAP